ncbi:BgTH12-01009 [Blumeria graminis f. sp. triticale]|uniref:BgTH12-01009 n=1 Tax=Blumeria graminis f. sp. triticale TaxID=1689686 RepID=A0A9W4D7L9_BLUGR|nr:BgTH12-01009 [Blumeria graminis f. sp. triticale]
MKFFVALLLSLLLISTPTIARSVNGSSLQKVDKRNSDPRHFGFECGSRKYKLSTCIDVVKDACEAHSNVRKPKNIVLNYTMAKHPMEFIRAQEFGYPNNTMIVELPLSLFEILNLNYVAFSPMDCKILGVVSKNEDWFYTTSFKACRHTSWPFNWLEK